METKFDLKKQITFIYTDSAEKAIYSSLCEEAKKRGYDIKLTDNIFEKCEIGVYCQHDNFPQYSKFSIIMLHDIIQQYSNWPDIWFREPWNKYDVGILPSDQWLDNWNKCSQLFYARPRKGMYKIGWPKADTAFLLHKEDYRNEFFVKYGLDLRKKTVLYAPAWENDGKQDEFVRAMLHLDVNILIKQWDANPEKFPDIVNNIKEMHRLHKDIERVTILPSQTNIFEAIAVADVLISEESSTMCEAVMMGIPAVSVSNWLIPDVKPSRFPKCDYDFVVTTVKERLIECVQDILQNYEKYHQDAMAFSKKNFSNIGKSSAMIMDIIDDYVERKRVRYTALTPQLNQNISLRRLIGFSYLCLRREIYDNYARKYKAVEMAWRFAKKVKHILKKEIN